MPPELIHASSTPDLVSVPGRRCLAIDGQGAPSAPAFATAVGALYGTAYALKFARKKAGSGDFKVGPLEGRWSADVPSGTTGVPSPELWRWRMRIGIPADVTRQEVAELEAAIVAKKGGKLYASQEVPRIFLEAVPAQRLGRVLHVGPYAAEPASFERITAVLAAAGLLAAPTHIEVYLNDPTRTRPEALKTVLLRELAR